LEINIYEHVKNLAATHMLKTTGDFVLIIPANEPLLGEKEIGLVIDCLHTGLISPLVNIWRIFE
jgi:hypothetical protein